MRCLSRPRLNPARQTKKRTRKAKIRQLGDVSPTRRHFIVWFYEGSISLLSNYNLEEPPGFQNETPERDSWYLFKGPRTSRCAEPDINFTPQAYYYF